MEKCQHSLKSTFKKVKTQIKKGVNPEKGARQKAPLKILRVSHPIRRSPFVVPTTRKEAPTGNAPMGATPPKAVISRFPQSGENRTTEAPEVIFDLIPEG